MPIYPPESWYQAGPSAHEIVERVGRSSQLATRRDGLAQRRPRLPFDLILECDGQEFGVHKAKFCDKSPVMRAALTGNFLEAKTSVLRVSFDIQSVRRLIEFIYRGDYRESLEPAIQFGEKQPTDKLSEVISDRLICHGRMNCVADYYDIPALAALSRYKAAEILGTDWCAEAFYNLVRQSVGSTGDKVFLKMLADVAVDHFFELLQRGFFASNLAEELAPHFLPMILSTLETEKECREHGVDVHQAYKGARLSQNTEESTYLLDELRIEVERWAQTQSQVHLLLFYFNFFPQAR
ncbi:hypothetical protein F5Y10DRAFT_263519 [Nemania abortiva]|nr:hypothetical protein F5Y10DRAFT_263519 [Nemania abortiva]